MKTHKTFLMIAGLALAIPTSLMAQQRGPGDRPEGGPGGRGFGPMLPVMTALDGDKDGELSAEEIKNAPKTLAKLDRNKDGSLDNAELMPPERPGEEDLAQAEPAVSPDRLARRERIQGRPQRGGGEFLWRLPVMAALDQDEDRAVSAEEIKNAATALGKLDTNQDGRIDRAEMRPNPREGGPRGQGAPGEGDRSPVAAVDRMMERDANHDGFLTEDELPGRMAALIERGDENKDSKLSRTELTALLGSTEGRGGFRRDGQAGPRGDAPRER